MGYPLEIRISPGISADTDIDADAFGIGGNIIAEFRTPERHKG